MSSHHVYFALSTGLSGPVTVPRGTLSNAIVHVEGLEETLGLKRTQYRDNAVHWDTFDPAFRHGFPDVEDKTLCEAVAEHNDWVRRFYEDLARWAAQPAPDGEELTPEQAQQFWHGLQLLTVQPGRWTHEYYRARMEHFYEVMRGRPNEGVTWGVPKLSPKQAGAVIWLFSELLDTHDIRLEVPRDRDYLASSYDGEYEWCERCGAVTNDDAADCRKRGCPVQAGWCDEDRPSWFKDAKATAGSR